MKEKISILYVDDYELDRELVKDALEREHGGFSVTEASGKSEFEVKLTSRKFDVVLSDFNIAGFEGLQVLAAVRQYDANLPVIIVTGTGSEEIAVKALKQGAADYVIKRPKHIQKLPKTIFAVLEAARTKTELAQSKERLALVLDSVRDALWDWRTDTGEVYFSPRWFTMLGYSPDELPSSYETWRDLLHPEDRDRAEKVISRHLESGGPFELEFRMRTKTGPYKWIMSRGKSVEKNARGRTVRMVGTHMDISGRKKVEQELKESERKLSHILQAIQAGVIVHDADTRIVDINPAAGRLLGMEMDSIAGKDALAPVWCFINEDGEPLDISEYPVNIVKRTMKPLKDYVMGIQTPGRTEPVWVLVHADPQLNDKGHLAEIIVSAMDISELKKTQKLLKEKQRQLLHSQKIESIGTLAGGIAHDFNNILSSIIGFTQLAIEKTENNPLLEDYLHEVDTAGKRAKDLIRQILTFARRSDEKAKPIQVSHIVEEVLKLIRSTIPTNIEIKSGIDSHSFIMGNTTHVHQILMNLYSNAAQAMEDTGGVLRVVVRDIVIDGNSGSGLSGLKHGNYMEISVSDTGVGIAPEIIDAVFDPYFTTKKPSEGTGMGLAVVHGIVENCGGKIFVVSTPGKGATFTVLLPVVLQKQRRRTPFPGELPKGEERILFVDDEAPIVKMGTQILEHLGYQVTPCNSSVDALALFRSDPDAFDLVFTDMTMPHMTGDKLAMAIMKIRPDIPVILCTGYSRKISNISASEIGIRAFAYKPMDKEALAKTVRKVLDSSRSEA